MDRVAWIELRGLLHAPEETGDQGVELKRTEIARTAIRFKKSKESKISTTCAAEV